MIAIKNWFLEKEMIRGFYGKELTIEKETAKAVLVKLEKTTSTHWIPKSCLCDEWEKRTSPFDYHEYMVNLIHDAYDKGIIENYTIKSGRNSYRGDNFVHQLKNKELQEYLNHHNIEYMTYEEFKNR